MDESFPAIGSDVAEDVVDIVAHVRKHLGIVLRPDFALPAGLELRQRLAYLVERFDNGDETPETRPDHVFRDASIAALWALRGFAVSLIGETSRADDLVQEALPKAWANRHRFTPSTNMNAWLFAILRSQFYTDRRKARREVEDADGTHAATLKALPQQEGVVNLKGLQDRLARIPKAQRTALMVVNAGGYTQRRPPRCSRARSARRRAASVAPAPTCPMSLDWAM